MTTNDVTQHLFQSLGNKISFYTKIVFFYESVWPVKSRQMSQSCPKMISQEKWKILITLQKMPKNVGNLGKIIVTKGFEKLPKVQ